MTAARALDALGDPTRRRVLEALRAGPRTVGDLAARLPVSRPAVSQHLRALHHAGLVTVQAQGRLRWYAVDRAGIDAVRRWADSFWGDVLGAFSRASDTQRRHE